MFIATLNVSNLLSCGILFANNQLSSRETIKSVTQYKILFVQQTDGQFLAGLNRTRTCTVSSVMRVIHHLVIDRTSVPSPGEKTGSL